MSCPILNGKIEQELNYKLSDKEIYNFCNNGCSVICEQLLREYITKQINKLGNLPGQVSWGI
ncbi:hypothetical protein SDC9_37754 [bioreactor metagenome]|uniref:Uncharacterized protein n=1 Tax=bioreactor metagenome TaxID=1076179 RepID=A0A644VK14_9ZZZZ